MLSRSGTILEDIKGVTILLSPAVYNEAMIFNACTPFMPDFMVNFALKGGRWHITLRPRNGGADARELAFAFIDSLTASYGGILDGKS